MNRYCEVRTLCYFCWRVVGDEHRRRSIVRNNFQHGKGRCTINGHAINGNGYRSIGGTFRHPNGNYGCAGCFRNVCNNPIKCHYIFRFIRIEIQTHNVYNISLVSAAWVERTNQWRRHNDKIGCADDRYSAYRDVDLSGYCTNRNNCG